MLEGRAVRSESEHYMFFGYLCVLESCSLLAVNVTESPSVWLTIGAQLGATARGSVGRSTRPVRP